MAASGALRTLGTIVDLCGHSISRTNTASCCLRMRGQGHSRVSHSVAGLKHKTKHFSKFNGATLGFAEMSKSNLFDVIIKQRFAERPQICDFAVALIKVRIF